MSATRTMIVVVVVVVMVVVVVVAGAYLGSLAPAFPLRK